MMVVLMLWSQKIVKYIADVFEGKATSSYCWIRVMTKRGYEKLILRPEQPESNTDIYQISKDLVKSVL